MPTIYLDACCLNRPFDDQSQDRIRLEAEAVLLILSHVQSDEWRWVGSDVLNLEIEQIPDLEKRAGVALLASSVQKTISIEPSIEARARELNKIGFRAFDAQHLASAQSGGAEIFLTTDDQLLRQAERVSDKLKVRVANPLAWIKEMTEK
ncbi:MAG: PIN domain-containing protein [Chloroflexi bacterium]|nr:PIN domain-containing protein [Chloroflexota bacterium]